MLHQKVSTEFGTFSLLITIFAVGAVGIVFSSEYESGCQPNANGTSVCTSRFAFKGWAGVPIQPLAAAVGTATGAYFAYIKAKKSLGEAPENISSKVD